MSIHVAQFRALALKNFSLQLKRKGNTCCQLFIPISIALIVGILQMVGNELGGKAAQQPWNNPFDVWNIGLSSPSYINISYTVPSDSSSSSSSLPPGVLHYFSNETNSGVMGMCPQGPSYTAHDTNSTIYKSPFLGVNYSSPDQIDQDFNDAMQRAQDCTNDYTCGPTQTAIAAMYFRYLQAFPQIVLNFTVQTGDTYALESIGFFSGDTVESYSYLTSMVHNSMYRYFFNSTMDLIVTGFTNMPFKDPSIDFLGNLFSLCMIPFAASFLFSVYMYTLVQEKKEGLVQKMHSCGLPMVTYWIVNYIYNYMLYLLIVIVLFAFGVGFGVEVFIKKPLELIVLLFLYGHAQVAMCQFLTCFLWAPTLASIVGFLLSIFGSLAGLSLEFFVFLQDPRHMPSVFYLLYPGFAFYHAFGLLIYELMDNSFPVVTLMPGTHFSNLLLILLAETIVLCILTWYFEAIFPREIGVRRNPFFPIISLIEKCRRKSGYDTITEDGSRDRLLEMPVHSLNVNEDDDVARERDLARNSDSLVRIMELTKIYPGANGKQPKLALNHLSLRIQANECFGLLGPNGAGKTTLLSTLCGTIAPTSGSAYINGLNINKNMENIHKILGICPQFDVLWSELTVTDHLLFYLRLKAAARGNENSHVKEIIEEVGLEEVAHRQATGLSGGQKRRLSIAIAMMGRPKLILMDEPTTGLDPSSRRALWDIIVKAKERHSIVLSTHSMEEAEVLCNRIGIMRKAQLHSVGTQMHLKNKFELGYNIKISHFLNCEEKAHNFVMETIPNAVMVRGFGGIKAYKVMKGDFMLSDLFKKMELNKYRYGIKEWSISQASLEEVFLAIVTEDEADEK